MCSIMDKIETVNDNDSKAANKLLALLVEDRFKVMSEEIKQTKKTVDQIVERLDTLISNTDIVLHEHYDCPVNRNKEDVQFFFTFLNKYPILFRTLIIASILIGSLGLAAALIFVIYGIFELISTGQSKVIDIIINIIK